MACKRSAVRSRLPPPNTLFLTKPNRQQIRLFLAFLNKIYNKYNNIKNLSFLFRFVSKCNSSPVAKDFVGIGVGILEKYATLWVS